MKMLQMWIGIFCDQNTNKLFGDESIHELFAKNLRIESYSVNTVLNEFEEFVLQL